MTGSRPQLDRQHGSSAPPPEESQLGSTEAQLHSLQQLPVQAAGQAGPVAAGSGEEAGAPPASLCDPLASMLGHFQAPTGALCFPVFHTCSSEDEAEDEAVPGACFRRIVQFYLIPAYCILCLLVLLSLSLILSSPLFSGLQHSSAALHIARLTSSLRCGPGTATLRRMQGPLPLQLQEKPWSHRALSMWRPPR